MLELKDASLTLGGRQLFEKLSMMAPSGQMTCITGPEGCGKTALVQVMLGFLLPDEGLVSIDGELLTPQSAPTFRRLMAYLPQKREVTITPVEADISGLEAVWAPFVSRQYELTPIEEHLEVVPMASKPIIIADDPDTLLLSALKSLAAGGHTVVVASRREEYTNLSDKIIMLGNHDAVIS
jgi:putative ABC transport system ATP-binding protein